MATCADILDTKLLDNAGTDAVSILPDPLGKATGPVREATVHHSINGSFAMRQGRWLFALRPIPAVGARPSQVGTTPKDSHHYNSLT